MARAVEDHWEGPLSGLVVTRYGYSVPCKHIEIVEAAHPVPDAAGEAAARRLFQVVEGLTADDLVLCLVSGGGSALLPLALPGLTLDDKQALSRALLASGASISKMNCVRRHLSAIKGGRLAAACRPARVVNLLLSDAPGDDPIDIASGPTVAHPTTCADAMSILRRYQIDVTPRALDLLKSGQGVDKLTYEMAVLKRLKFAATSERFASTLAPAQKSLLEETLDADLAELEREIERERGQADDKAKDKTEKKTPKRTPRPPHLPRHDVPHEPADTSCGCGQPMQRFGEDVAERLDYQPGVFSVERHVRGKWACRCCEKIVAGAGACTRHRQGHPDGWAAGTPAGREVHGSSAAVPAGVHLRARRPPDRALDPGAVGGRVRRTAAAAGAGTGRRTATPCRAARRRDAGGHAQTQTLARRQDAQGLHLVVLHPVDSDIAQLTAELEQAAGDKPDEKDKKTKQSPKREPLPPHLPRRDVHHEPENTACDCG